MGYGTSCGFLPKHLETVVSANFLEKLRRDNNADVPPGFDVKECTPTLLSNQCQNSFAFTADCVTVKSEASMGILEEPRKMLMTGSINLRLKEKEVITH